jgi:PAS domain S-box-containing protein
MTPAFALIDRDRQVLRSTDGLRELGVDWEAACEGSLELERVLVGEAECATLQLGETSFVLDAVKDSAGAPHALLTLPGEMPAGTIEAASDVDDPVAHLRAALDESPVIAWLKDPSGHYLHVNPRYVDDLGVTQDRLLGHTDADVSQSQTVDGPRLSGTQDGVEEPVELEYLVPAFGERPALTVIRFMIRDHGGEPVALCGMAAPLEESHRVRDEVARILKIERWSRMSSAAVRAELLVEWGLELGTAEEPHERHADTVSPPLGESHSEPALVPLASRQPSELGQRWDDCVQGLQEEARRWHDEVERARAERDAAERALATERERTRDLVSAIARLRAQIADLGHAIDDALPFELDSQSGDVAPGASAREYPLT